MQNEFEKQVKLKMEELDLVPSAPVWKKIEEQIREKKDRRRIILWFFLGAVIIAGSILWLSNSNIQQGELAKTSETNVPAVNSNEQLNSSADKKSSNDHQNNTKQNTTTVSEINKPKEKN